VLPALSAPLPGADAGRSWCGCEPVCGLLFFSGSPPGLSVGLDRFPDSLVRATAQHSGGGAALQVRTLAEAVFVEFVVRGKRRKQPVVRIVSAPTVPSPPLPALPPPLPHRFILPRTRRQLCHATGVQYL
jgi:hypothetical protein